MIRSRRTLQQRQNWFQMLVNFPLRLRYRPRASTWSWHIARPVNLAPEVALDLELVQDENQIAGQNATGVVTSDGVAVEVLGDIGLSRALEQQAARVEVAPMVVEVAAITVAESSEAAGNTRKRR